MANGNYKLTELDYQILKACETPMTSREVATVLNGNYKTVLWKIGQLKALGLLDKSRTQKKNAECHSFRYTRVEGAEIPEQAKVKQEYKPLGMCIMGVWL